MIVGGQRINSCASIEGNPTLYIIVINFFGFEDVTIEYAGQYTCERVRAKSTVL